MWRPTENRWLMPRTSSPPNSFVHLIIQLGGLDSALVRAPVRSLTLTRSSGLTMSPSLHSFGLGKKCSAMPPTFPPHQTIGLISSGMRSTLSPVGVGLPLMFNVCRYTYGWLILPYLTSVCERRATTSSYSLSFSSCRLSVSLDPPYRPGLLQMVLVPSPPVQWGPNLLLGPIPSCS